AARSAPSLACDRREAPRAYHSALGIWLVAGEAGRVARIVHQLVNQVELVRGVALGEGERLALIEAEHEQPGERQERGDDGRPRNPDGSRNERLHDIPPAARGAPPNRRPST